MHHEQRQKHFTTGESWAPTGCPGVERKPLAANSEDAVQEVSLLRLAPGAGLPTLRVGWGIEVLVLDGTWLLPEGPLGANSYSRRPPELATDGTSPSGCILYLRSFQFAAGDRDVVHMPADDGDWHPGHGNLTVKSLHGMGDEGTALVHWPAGERFVPHQHQGGEEILVLSGMFRDEHGTYPSGTWIQSPHLSTHYPFVEEETLICVKTGHLMPSVP